MPTPEEEKALEQAHEDLKAGRYKTFKNADELIRYLRSGSRLRGVSKEPRKS